MSYLQKKLKFALMLLVLFIHTINSTNIRQSNSSVSLSSSTKRLSSTINTNIYTYNISNSTVINSSSIVNSTLVPSIPRNNLMNVTQRECFFDTVGNLISRLQQSISYYSNVCNILNKPKVNRLLMVSRIVSLIEAYQNVPLNQTPPQVPEAMKSLDQFNDFKFSSYLLNIKEGLNKGQSYSEILKNLWTSMSDELDTISKSNNYPFFFRKNIWSLIQVERSMIVIREQYSKNLTDCVPNDWQNIFQIYDLFNDQNFVYLYKQDGNRNNYVNNILVSSNAFENGGVVLTFWGSENVVELEGRSKSIFVGYINNNRVYEYFLIPQNYTMIHRLQILDKYIDIKSDSNCATYFFVIIALQKDCDRFKLVYSVRSLAPNTRQGGEIELTTDQVENLNFVFDKNTTYSNSYYKNFKYSRNLEFPLITYSLDTTNWNTFTQRSKCAPNCEYSNGKECLLCKNSTYNIGGSCVSNCPNNTFISNRACQSCNPLCVNCNGPNNGDCLNCKEPYNFFNGNCDVKCPSNLAADENRQCKPCGSNCAACKDLKTCGACDSVTFLKDGQCVPNCGEYFFKSFIPNVCIPCPTGCLTCENADKCTSCREGYFLKGKDCVPDCGEEFWGDKSTRTCKQCDKNCKLCKDSVNCIECNKGFYSSNQTCISTCPVGTISVNGVCVKCKQEECEVCSANNVADCKRCNTTNFLKDSICVNNCGTGFYADTNKNCQTCPKDCNVCTRDKCLQCKDNQFILNDNTCAKECPDGYTSSGNLCVKCSLPDVCNKCLDNNLDTCTKCYPGKFLLNGKCLDKCPDRYFPSGDTCQPCNSGCEVCSSIFNCLVCSKTHFLQNFKCVDKCDTGFSAVVNNVCEPCKVLGCENCSKDLSICEKCKEKVFLYNNQCIEKCPLGSYPLPTMTCDTCMTDCIECSNKTSCTKCKPEKVLQGTNCFSICDDGYVAINGECTKCKNMNCRKCLSSDTTKCLECPVGSFLYNGDCVKICPPKTYPNNNAVCLDCKTPCNNCVNENECVDCVPKFSLNGKNCTDNCPQKTVSINNKCFECHDKNCLKCNDVVANTCIQCDKGLVLFNGACLDACPNNYFSENGVCKACLTNCKKCKDTNTCDECIEKFNLKDGNQCTKECGDGYTLFPNNICRKCHSSCLQCQISNVNQCTKCYSNYFLFNSECRTTCPEGTFATPKMTCENCPMSNCLNCEGGKTCLNCNPSYVLQENLCQLPPCGEGWVQKSASNECMKCEVSNCKNCPNTNTKKCDYCISNYYLIGDFKCEKDCIIGTYKNPANRKCENCSKNCLTCSDNLNCSECEMNYYLMDGVCVSQCPTGYSKVSGKCMPCQVKDCDICSDNKVCERCKAPLLLQNGLCQKDCNKGYFGSNGICKACPLFCNECENENKCKVCQQGKILTADDKCTDECPSGSVVNAGKCVLCQSDQNCEKCGPSNLKQCLSCKGNFVLKSNTCVENCGDSFYTSARTCSPCKQDCKKCLDGSTCLECDKGLALFQDKCIPTCPSGYRKENEKCLPCSAECTTCDIEKCLVCGSGLLLENGKCVKTCSKAFYTTNNINCYPCDTGCQSCLTEKTCNICSESLFLKEGKCVEKCGVGYVAVSGKCEKCGANCNECNALNPSECTLCEYGKALLSGFCLDKCSTKYYLENGKCLKCLSGCDVCQNDKTCDKCNPSLYISYDSRSCLTNCPDGFRADQSRCVPCEDKKCVKCNSNANICEVCNTPNLLYNGICVPSCPDGYFREETGKKCEKCLESCSKCVSNKKCTECVAGYSLQNDVCVNSCKPGSISVNSVCKECETSSCEICKPNLSTCERCEKGKVLFTVTNSTLTLIGNLTGKVVNNNTIQMSNSTIGINSTLCMDVCPVGFYENNGACSSCGENCNKCNNINQCNLCSSGYVLQDGKCQLRCNRYYVEKNGECVRCEDQKCISCDPVTRKECKVCDENYVLKNNECKSYCGFSYFKFEVTKNNSICKPCPFKCEICNNENTCDKCMEGGFLKNNQCVMDCGQRWVLKDNTKCVECTSKNCLVCDPNNPDRCITCSSDSYLKSGLCVNTCGDKYFASDKGLCLPCVDPSCITCSPNDKCSVCEKGKVILNGACHNNCPSGMVPNKDNVCVSCNDKNCDVCEMNDLNKCSRCLSGYLLQQNLTCSSNCPSKQYNHLNERCLPCANNCDVCKSEKECTVCSGKMLLDANKMCVDKCDNGYVEIQGKCEKCNDSNCFKCQSNDQAICDVCLPGFNLYRGQCVNKCPPKTFTLGTNCVNCGANCVECNSESDCKVCEKDFILFNKACITNCPEGHFELNKECFKCPNFERTKTCDRLNPVVPLNCKPGYFLDKICVENCPDGKFPDSNKVCQPCGQECFKCASLSECKKCSEKTVLYKGNCTNTCPVGSINILGICVDCKNQNCNQCQQSDLTKCTFCKDKLFFLNNDCLSNCPEGYYTDGQNCLKCDDKCAECKNVRTCDRCLNQFVNMDGTCVSECPKGTALRNGKCYACADSKCNLCDNVDLNNCLSCRDGYLFNKICYNECAQGYRADNVTRTCVPCSKYCDKCDDKGCLVCTKGYYFSETDNRFCMECSDPSLVIVNNRTCEKCKVQGCKRCEDGNTNSCKVCDSAKVLVNGLCLDKCPDGSFRVDQSCQSCEKGCKVCSNPNTCDQCETPLIVFNSKCITKCPDSWAANNKGSCVQCAQQDCDICDSSNTALCSSCKLPSMLYKGQCYKICPTGTYPDSPNCKECPNGCNICNKNQCEGCLNNMKLKGSECVNECGLGYYENLGRCEKCIDSNCAICSPANICKKCNPNTYLMESTFNCVVTCKEGYFPNNEKGICQKCDDGCSTCKSSGQCTICEKGLFLYDGRCNQACPDGYSPYAGICKSCDPGCLSCPNSQDLCESCNKGNLFEKKCIPTCPKGTFTENGKCMSCDRKCDECISKYECLKCKSEFNLYKDKCMDKCSDGKVEINGKCISCSDKNCKSCLRDTNICVECNVPFVIYDNGCRPSCPEGSYAGDDKVCQLCADGCVNCTNDSTCLKCTAGFFLLKNKCVRECPKGMWGNCSDNQCYNCLEACEDCSDGSALNCPKCNNGYFKNENICVKESGCRRGTYPNKETRKCTSCRIPFCAACIDQTKCKECVRGFELNKNNECVLSKTFVPLIGQEGKLFSPKSIQLFRNYVSFNEDLRGTGVNSDNISFTFWLRKFSEISTDTKVFMTESGSIAMNFGMDMVLTEGKEICRLLLIQDQNINILELGTCSYQELYNWTFFSFTLSQVNDKGYADVRIINNKGINRKRNLDFPISKTVTFINKNSTLSFSKNVNKDEFLNSEPFEIANLNILDYDATPEDINPFTLQVPNDCDYSCSDCRTKCNLCQGNILPSSEGFCPASFVSLLNDYQYLLSPISVELRSKVVLRLNSERYGLFMWFNTQNSLTTNTTEIGSIYYNYPKSEVIMRFFIKNNGLWVQVGQEFYEVFAKNIISTDKWYFIGAHLKSQSLFVYIRDLFQINEVKTINLKYLPNRLTEDAVFFNGPYKELNNTSTTFTGAFYDVRLYVNNIPTDDDILNHYNKLPCPRNCLKCGKSMTCETCNQGYKLQNNFCVDNKLSVPVELLDKYSFFRNDTLTLTLPGTFNLTQYTISFFYKRKIHSLPSLTHNVLSIEGTDGRTYPLVQQLNGQNDVSTFTVLGQNSTGSTFTHDFSNEIYNYIHFIVTVNIPTKTLTYFINDGKENTFSKPISTEIRKLILGDSTRNELNFEIANLYIYEGIVAKEDFPKLQSTIPIDCDAGCINCDYKTGTCNTCLNGKPTEIRGCTNALRGFSHAHIYNANSLNQNISSQYSSSLNDVYKKDVNSMEYSVVGYYRLFNTKTFSDRSNARYQLFRVSNRLDQAVSSSSNLIGLDIATINNVTNYYITYNDGKVVGSYLVRELAPTTEWCLVLITVNVRDKTIKYAIQQLNSARIYLDTIKLNNYPERLTENANLNLFGYGTGSTSVYQTMDLQFYRIYIGINTQYNLEILEKFRKSFPLPEDPKCPADCDKCIVNEKEIVQCLSCVTGFDLDNDQCYRQDSKFVMLADQTVYSYLPPKTDISMPNNVFLNPKNTITFYFIRNYSPRVQSSDSTIFRGGNVEIKLNGVIKGESSLIVSINKYPGTLLFAIDTNLNEDYNWYLVIINFSSNVLDVIVKNEKSNVKKGFNLDNNFKLEIPSISFNTLNDQVSIYAPNVILRNFYEINFVKPNTFCNLECDVCIENKCVECHWGLTPEGTCVKKPVSIPSFRVEKSTNYTNQYSLRKYLDNPKPLRSRSWSLRFTFELSSSFNSYASNAGNSIFTLTDGNDINNSNILFNVNFNPNNSFFITFLNRFYVSDIGSSFGFATNSFKTEPLNSLYVVVISYNDDKNEFSFYAYNSNENYIKQTFTLKGRGENLNLDSNLVFASNLKNFNQTIIFEHVDFYFESSLDETEINKFLVSRLHNYQNACLLNTRISCLKCNSNSQLIGTVCSPVNHSQNAFLNKIKQITGLSTQIIDQKFRFINDSTQFTLSFWFKLFTYTKDPFGILSFNVQDGNTKYPLLQVHHSNNNLIVDLYDSTSKQVNSIRLDNMITLGLALEWTYLSISVDVPTNTLNIYYYESRQKKNRILTNSVPKVIPNLVFNSSKNATINLGYETSLRGVGYQFEASSIVFTSGWFAKDTNELELYRIRIPRKCSHTCTEECDSFNLCPANGFFTSDINIPDIYIKNASLKGKYDASSLQTINLFRNISSSLPISQGNFIFHDFLITFEIDVPTLLSSSYKPNNNVVLSLSNSINQNYTSLTMNDLIPSEVLQYGIIGVEIVSEGLKFWIGSSLASNTVNYYILNFQSLSGLNKITVQLYMDTINQRARVIAFVDDLRTFYDIQTIYPLQPISSNTLIYMNPTLNFLRVNVNNSRFLYDYNLNFRGKSQDMTTYSSKKCGNECVKCSFVSKGMIFSCDRCQRGYVLINNLCVKSNNI